MFVLFYFKGLIMELKLMPNDDMQGGYWVDSNNNKWDITLYSKKRLKNLLKALIIAKIVLIVLIVLIV